MAYVRARLLVFCWIAVAGCAADHASDVAATGDAGADAESCRGALEPSVSSLDPTHYDQTCTTDAECVPFVSAVSCGNDCSCPTAALNFRALGAVQEDYARARADCKASSCFPTYGCGVCEFSAAECIAGRCVVTRATDDNCRCGPGQVCVGLGCHTDCTSNQDCPNNEACNLSVCRPPPECPRVGGVVLDAGCATVCHGVCQ